MSDARPPQAPRPDVAAAPSPSAHTPGEDAYHDVRSLSFALAGTFVLRCASYGAGTIIPIFLGLKSRHDHEMTAGLASLVAVSFYLAELVGAPLFGSFSDRWGRRAFMLLGPIFGGVAIQMLGFTAIIPILVLVRVLEGLSTAASAPATLGYLSAGTAHSPRLRGRIMGFYEAATVVGLASGGAISASLYQRFGIFAFTLVALIYVVALVLFWQVREHPEFAAFGASHKGHHAHGFARRLLNGRILRFAPAWLAANAVVGAWMSIGPFLAAQAPDPEQFLMGGYTPREIGLAQLVFGVLFTLGAVFWGFLMPRIGRQTTLLWGVGGLGLTSVALWVLNQADPTLTDSNVAPIVALVMLGILIEAGFTPAALAYLAEIAEEHAEDRGSVMGIYSVLLSVGALTGGALGGQFAQRWQFDGLIVLTGLLTLIAAFTVALLGFTERRHLARQQQAQALAHSAAPSSPAASTSSASAG